MCAGFRGGWGVALLCGVLLAGSRGGEPEGPGSGDPAPAIVGVSVDGRAVDTRSAVGRALVLVFVSTEHASTPVCLRQVEAALGAARGEHPIEMLVVLTKGSDPASLPEVLGDGPVRPLVLLDTERRAYRAYAVVALPTVVVIDEGGRIAHSIRGPSDRLPDILLDCVLYAGGRLSRVEFEASLDPTGPVPAGEDDRGRRRLRLGSQLARRRLFAAAATQYERASGLLPGSSAPRVALGWMRLRQGELGGAEAAFADAAVLEPGSMDAMTGLGAVHALRGGEGLDEAERVVGAMRRLEPHSPGADYVMGLVLEGRGRASDAAGAFRRAAEALVDAGAAFGRDDG